MLSTILCTVILSFENLMIPYIAELMDDICRRGGVTCFTGVKVGVMVVLSHRS